MSNDATVKFGYDGRELDAGMRDQERRLNQHSGRIESIFSRMGSGINRSLESVMSLKGLAAGAGITGMISFGKAALETYDQVASESKKLNTSAETLQRLGHAAEILGNTDLETLSKGLMKLRRQLIDEPAGDMAKGLEEIGLKAEDFLRMDADAQMLTLADAFGKASESGSALPLLTQAMGKGFAELIPLLSGGREELKKFMDESVVMSNSAIAGADELNDKFDVMTGKIGHVAKALALAGASGLAEMFGLKPRTELDSDGSKAAAKDAADNAANQAKRDAEAEASIQKKRDEEQKKSAEKQKEEAVKVAAAQEKLSKIKQDAAEQEMTTKEKIADVRKRLEDPGEQKTTALEQIELATRKVELQMKLNNLLKDQQREVDALAEKEKREAKDKDDREKRALKEHEDRERRKMELSKSRNDVMGSLEALRLRARGNDKGADKIERQQKINDDAARIREQTGASEEQAMKLATERARLEDKLEGRRSGRGSHIGGVQAKRYMGSGLDQFERNQEKEYETTDPARPGYQRGRPRPKYDAFGRDNVPLTSAQRNGRYMGGDRAGTRSYSDVTVASTAASQKSGGLAEKIDESNKHLKGIDEKLT